MTDSIAEILVILTYKFLWFLGGRRTWRRIAICKGHPGINCDYFRGHDQY